MLKTPKILPLTHGNSLFSLVSKFCLDEASGNNYNSAFHRLCSLMRKMNVKTAVVEDLNASDQEINGEYEALSKYFDREIKIQSYKFTFLSKQISNLEEIQTLDNCSFLSSAIIINYNKTAPGETNSHWQSYLYNAVVTKPRIQNHEKYKTQPLLNNYLHITKVFKRNVSISSTAKHDFEIIGTFFCQQNSITSVCANAALCMIINNIDTQQHEIITTEDINRIIGIDHKTIKFKVTKDGLTKDDLEKVLNAYNLSFDYFNFIDNPNIEYDTHIYRYVESRYPVLLVFQTDNNTAHVVPVLGHTLNSDTWRPEAVTAYSPTSRLDLAMSTSAYVDHFIIHDDNFGMYLCLPVDSLKRITLPKYDPTFRAVFAIAIIPKEVNVVPREAEWASNIIAVDVLKLHEATESPLDEWTNRYFNRIKLSRPIVIRTHLISKKDYCENLLQADSQNNFFSAEDKIALIANLPDLFWLSELTLPDLYTANKSKIIDFFYSSNAQSDKLEDKWLQIRFPYVLIRNKKNAQVEIIPMSIKSHYPMLRFGNEDSFDW